MNNYKSLDDDIQALPWSEDSFLYMKMLANRCGLDLANYKKQALYNRLEKRIRSLELPNFDAYCAILQMDLEEEITFINLITNPTTYFFRENHHFEYLVHHVLPALIAKKNKIRIWSAGCSTGEEPYSIAMYLYEKVYNLQHYDIKILATDVNTDSLMTAETGIYDINRLNDMSFSRKKRWFKPTEDAQYVEINHKLKALISFQKLNFMDFWPMHGPFDVIFCRNVLIYFKKEIVRVILHQFDDLMKKDALLFLGYSENLHDLRDKYIHEGKTIFKKK